MSPRSPVNETVRHSDHRNASRSCAGVGSAGAPIPTPPALLAEAFRWGEWRTVSLTGLRGDTPTDVDDVELLIGRTCAA